MKPILHTARMRLLREELERYIQEQIGKADLGTTVCDVQVKFVTLQTFRVTMWTYPEPNREERLFLNGVAEGAAHSRNLILGGPVQCLIDGSAKLIAEAEAAELYGWLNELHYLTGAPW
jgi:hypothetical protein